VPLIGESPAFGADGVIIIVYDEDERAGGLAKKNGFGQGGHVVCAILSPLARSGQSDQKYYHYSLLRTLEDGFSLSDLGRRRQQRCPYQRYLAVAQFPFPAPCRSVGTL
jgi:hypothetical protein